MLAYITKDIVNRKPKTGKGSGKPTTTVVNKSGAGKIIIYFENLKCALLGSLEQVLKPK